MKPFNQFSGEDWRQCHWRGVGETFAHLATSQESTQSQRVVKPLHWYIACRLVIEGGFLPEEIRPRPPFSVSKQGLDWVLQFDATNARSTEATVLGGLKTKDVDIVVEKPGIGPVIAISCKCTGNAFRNLTNRMEEAVGECTNLHMTYPALVTGYFSVLRAHRIGSDPGIQNHDMAIDEEGDPVDGIVRYHDALCNLTGREDIRDTISKYETVAVALLETSGPNMGHPLDSYPTQQSPVRAETFFDRIYRHYDLRFVYSAPIFATRNVTPRRLWSADSPLFDELDREEVQRVPQLEYVPRVKDEFKSR